MSKTFLSIGSVDVSAIVTGDKEVIRALQTLSAGALDKAVARAVRYAGQAAAPAVAKNIRRHYNLPSARIKSDVKVGYSNDTATVRLNDRSTTVMQFGAKITGNSSSIRSRRVKKGVLTWKIMKRGGRKKSRNAWLMPGKQGGSLLPFHRTGTGRKEIDVIHGPSIRRSLLSGAHSDAIREEITTTLGLRLQRRLLDGIKQHLRTF